MAIGRSRFAPPYVSTKGHSVLKQRSYAMPTRNPPASSVSRVSGGLYDTRAEEYLLADRVSNVNYLSNTLMDEGYDTALKSRGRDQQLLREATNAIVSSESYATPQTSVASRRVARGQSVVSRAASVPPRPLKTEHRSSYVRSTRKVEEEDDDQPKPLMSWKYRLDSMLSPSDLLYKPSSLIRIREQVKDAQEKMSRHRDMLDKYLPEGGADTGDVAASIRRKTALMESRDPSARRRERRVREEETTEIVSDE